MRSHRTCPKLGVKAFRDLKINDEFTFVHGSRLPGGQPRWYRVVGFTRRGYTIYEPLWRTTVSTYSMSRANECHVDVRYRSKW